MPLATSGRINTKNLTTGRAVVKKFKKLKISLKVIVVVSAP